MVRPDSEARGSWRLGKPLAKQVAFVFEPGKAGRFGVEMLNCKQGDLAILVRSYAGNEGAIVRCLELAEPDFDCPPDCGPRWMVDREFMTSWGDRTRTLPDANLRPLRDSDGDDEMLRLVGAPERVLV